MNYLNIATFDCKIKTIFEHVQWKIYRVKQIGLGEGVLNYNGNWHAFVTEKRWKVLKKICRQITVSKCCDDQFSFIEKETTDEDCGEVTFKNIQVCCENHSNKTFLLKVNNLHVPGKSEQWLGL